MIMSNAIRFGIGDKHNQDQSSNDKYRTTKNLTCAPHVGFEQRDSPTSTNGAVLGRHGSILVGETPAFSPANLWRLTQWHQKNQYGGSMLSFQGCTPVQSAGNQTRLRHRTFLSQRNSQGMRPERKKHLECEWIVWLKNNMFGEHKQVLNVSPDIPCNPVVPATHFVYLS